jgi:hypothetical protein
MGWLRVVIRVGVMWLLSIAVSFAGMELAHRMILASERGTTAHVSTQERSAVTVGDERDQARNSILSTGR